MNFEQKALGIHCRPNSAPPFRIELSDCGNYVLDFCIYPYTPLNTAVPDHNTHIIGTDSQRDVLAELALEGLVVLLLQHAHVVGDVQPEDVLAVHLRVQLLLLAVVAGETLGRVGDVQAAVDGSLEGAEDTRSGGGAVQADVQEATERARTVVQRLHVVLVAGDLCAAGVQAVQTQLLQDTARDQQTGAVGGGVVGQASLSRRWENKFQ